MTTSRRRLPVNCKVLHYWEAGHGTHGEQIVVGISDVRGWMSGCRAQAIADEIIFQLCYAHDLAEPEEEVFV